MKMNGVLWYGVHSMESLQKEDAWILRGRTKRVNRVCPYICPLQLTSLAHSHERGWRVTCRRPSGNYKNDLQ